MESNLIGYLDRKTWIHQLSGAAKLICFLLLSVIGMISYDTRFLIGLALFSVFLFASAGIRYRDIAFVIYHLLFAFEFGGCLSFRTRIWGGDLRYAPRDFRRDRSVYIDPRASVL